MSSSTASDGDPVVVLGEVRTSLLMHGDALPATIVERLLAVVPGQPVLPVRQPLERVSSPDRLTGVACPLNTWDGTKARGIGTVLSHATITGGRLLQGSTRASLRRVRADRRMPWENYLSRPGVLDVATRAGDEDLAEGFLADERVEETLDLGAIANHLMEVVQRSTHLDKKVTLRARPHRMRWVAILGGGGRPMARIRKEADETFTTVRMTAGANDLKLAMRFCEDLALHDWLLSTVSLKLTQSVRAAAVGKDPLELLRPVLAQLVHLWMPGAHVDPTMRTLWEELEKHPGYTRSWTSNVGRMRDRINLQ